MKKKNIKEEKEMTNLFIDSSYVTFDDKDYLENYIYSDELTNKINNYFRSNNKKPLYIGIIGQWGSGKTSIVETSLKKQDKETVIYRYDAWKYEGDSFRRSFIQSVLNQSIEQNRISKMDMVYKKISESLYEDYSVSANSIIERLKQSNKRDKNLSWLSLIILLFVCLCIVGLGIYNLCINQTTLGNIITFLGEMGFFTIFYSTTVYSKSKFFSSEQFYKSFIDILCKVNGKKNILLIDNLDRCNKEEVKKTLTVIKGFYLENDESKLNGEKIVFVIPLDINSLNDAYPEYTIQFLDKIFDDMLYVKTKYNTDKLDFINRVLKEYQTINYLISQEGKSIIVNSSINTPREIIKTINDYVTEYSILKNKTSKKFVENDNNRNYLMKTVILKRRYYDFYILAFDNLEEYMRLEKNAFATEDLTKYKNREELMSFLTRNRSISPTNYYDFFQNQNLKEYNQIPDVVKNAISSHDIETIRKNIDKDRIIEYYKNINDDVYNDFWNPNILNKYVTLIEMFKSNYLNENELAQIIDSWGIVFNNQKFFDLNTNNVNNIGYDNELIFGTDIYKNEKFVMHILNSLRDGMYHVINEDDKYEKIKKWLIKNSTIQLDEKYADLLNAYCEYLLNNNHYADIDYLRSLFNKNIKIVTVDNIQKLISNNTDNENIFDLLKVLIEEKINSDQLVNELINWLYNHEIKNIKVINSILYYVKDNDGDISAINIRGINIDGNVDEEDISKIIRIYDEKHIYNDTLFNLLKAISSDKNIGLILSDLTHTIPENNSEYISHFINYYFGLSFENRKEYLKKLVKVVGKYPNSQEDIINRIINDDLLYLYYKSILTSKEREQVLDISDRLLSNDFKRQLKNIFIYESDYSRMKKLLISHNSISDYISIINVVNKKTIRDKVIKEFINFIKEKENIIDEEIEMIESLIVEDDIREEIKRVLYSKEAVNKELVSML